LIGIGAGVLATTAVAAPAEPGQNFGFFFLIALGCVALVLLRRRA